MLIVLADPVVDGPGVGADFFQGSLHTKAATYML